MTPTDSCEFQKFGNLFDLASCVDSERAAIAQISPKRKQGVRPCGMRLARLRFGLVFARWRKFLGPMKNPEPAILR